VCPIGALTVTLIGALCYGTPSTQNLVANPSFEQGTDLPDGWDRWSPAGATLARDTTVAHTGRASARIDIGPDGAEYPHFIWHVRGVTAGEVYDCSVFARTQDATGLGAYVTLEFLSGGTRLPFAQGELTGAGTHDWMPLHVRGMVPDGADTVGLCLVTYGQGTVWFDDAQMVRMQGAPAPFLGRRATLEVCPSRVVCRRFAGFGANGDYFLTRSVNTRRGVDDADRARVLERVAAMRPHIIRTLFSYEWWEPEEGRRTPDSEAMQDYIGWVRFLKSIGCAVFVHPWGDYFAYSDWMRDGTNRLPRPEKRDAMVRSLADLIEYLRRDQNLDNVRYLDLMNEPDNDPTRPVDPDEYTRLCRLLDRELRAHGLRDEVTLTTADDSTGPPLLASKWFREITSRGLDYADAVTTHTYKHRYVPSLAPWLRDEMAILGEQPKRVPLFITEFGYSGPAMDTFKNPENEDYEYGLFMADFAITALSEGASAALAWCLFDTYYDDVHCQGYGLWKYKDEGWQPRPGFYSWSLINRYTRPGSRVFAVDTGDAATCVRAVALESPAGELTILAVNRSERAIHARLVTRLGREATLRVYRYTRESVPTPDEGMLCSVGYLKSPARGAAFLDLPPESFVLLTEVQ